MLSVGYGPISVAYADGTYDSTPSQDYSFASITAEYKGAYITYGSWGKDFTGSYTEVGYSKTISDIDYSVALINNDKDLDVKAGLGETAMTFGISYAWDL